MIKDNRLTIYRGADKQFFTRLHNAKTGDTLSLSSVTGVQVVFLKSDRTKLILSNDVKPAVKAQGSYEQVTFWAVDGGMQGNTIQLYFNGIDTIKEVISTWNALNSANTVSTHVQYEDRVLPEGTLKLNGGCDSYAPVEIWGEAHLGKLFVRLSERETAMLRVGSNHSFTVVIDYGEHTGGIRNIGEFENSVDVRDAFA